MNRFFLYILFILFVQFVHAVDIGSDTAVTRFNSQQVVGDGDRIAGFAALAAGFRMSAAGLQGTFDSFFPVIGDVQLNLATLILNQDLIFHDVSNFVSLGNIDGQNHRIVLSPSMRCIPTGTPNAGCSVTLIEEITPASTVNAVDWSFDALYAVAGTQNGNLIVYSWDGTNLTLITSVNLGNPILSVAWHPAQDWIAVGRASGGGDEIYTYNFNRGAGTLTLISSIDFGGGGNNACNNVRWWPNSTGSSTDALAFARNSPGSGIKFGVYRVNATGALVTGGGSPVTLSFNSEGQSVGWRVDGAYLAIGITNSGTLSELQVYIYNNGALTLTANGSLDIGGVRRIDWNPDQINIIGMTTRSSTNPRIKIIEYNPGAGSLMELTTGISVGTASNALSWRFDGVCLVAGIDNNAEGSGGEFRVYSFNNPTLTQDDDQEVGADVNAVKWSYDGNYVLTGNALPAVRVYEIDSLSIDLTSFYFNNVGIYMNNDLSLADARITFSGDNTWNGDGHILSLSATATIELAEGGNLLFQDITVKIPNDGKIYGVDSLSTFSFENVTFVLDSDFTFSVGNFAVLDDFRIVGDGHTFRYQSDAISMVRSGVITDDYGCEKNFCGRMIVDQGVTFEYDPISGGTNNIQFDERESQLVLNGGILSAATAWELLGGTFIIDGKSFISGASSITLGDGSSQENNMCVEVRPAANLDIVGQLIYSNI